MTHLKSFNIVAIKHFVNGQRSLSLLYIDSFCTVSASTINTLKRPYKENKYDYMK